MPDYCPSPSAIAPASLHISPSKSLAGTPHAPAVRFRLPCCPSESSRPAHRQIPCRSSARRRPRPAFRLPNSLPMVGRQTQTFRSATTPPTALAARPYPPSPAAAPTRAACKYLPTASRARLLTAVAYRRCCRRSDHPATACRARTRRQSASRSARPSAPGRLAFLSKSP